MKMFKVTDSAFRKYGKIVDNVDFTGLVEELKKTPCPDHVVYEPSAEALEALPVMEELSRVVYGEMPIQIGYCNGHNVMLNALEYHRDSEINVAAGDAVLMLGLRTDVEADYTYDTAKVEAFLLPAGTAVEIYATTLHYAPCQADARGFRVFAVLPDGSNTKKPEIRPMNEEDRLLFAKNKWLLAHPDSQEAAAGAFVGLKGTNIDISKSL